MEKNPYLRLVAAALFAAVCAYLGAALYPRLAAGGRLSAAAERVEPTCRLEGIALRRESALSLPAGSRLFRRDGERLSGDAVLAAMSGQAGSSSAGSCVFLAFSDGLEALSVEDARPLSVDRIRSLMAAEGRPRQANARLVAGFDWYYAAVTDYRGALPEGSCLLRFDGFEAAVPARLVEEGPYENGERALLFRLTAGAADYLKLRMVGAELALPESEA